MDLKTSQPYILYLHYAAILRSRSAHTVLGLAWGLQGNSSRWMASAGALGGAKVELFWGSKMQLRSRMEFMDLRGAGGQDEKDLVDGFAR